MKPIIVPKGIELLQISEGLERKVYHIGLLVVIAGTVVLYTHVDFDISREIIFALMVAPMILYLALKPYCNHSGYVSYDRYTDTIHIETANSCRRRNIDMPLSDVSHLRLSGQSRGDGNKRGFVYWSLDLVLQNGGIIVLDAKSSLSDSIELTAKKISGLLNLELVYNYITFGD